MAPILARTLGKGSNIFRTTITQKSSLEIGDPTSIYLLPTPIYLPTLPTFYICLPPLVRGRRKY